MLLRSAACSVVAASLLAGALLASSVPARAESLVEVSQAWARPAVPGQHGTGAFMTLKARQPARLVGAASNAAAVVEIHEMAMEGNVMRMRAVPGLDLPADRAVELKPGGYHVMLLDLKRPLKVGEKISVDLRLELGAGADKRLVTQPVEIEVRTRAQGAEPKGEMKH